MPPDAAIQIRPLCADDLPDALAIQAASYPAFLRENRAAFLSRIEIDGSCCLAATREGVLVAYILAHGWVRAAPPAVGTILPRHAAMEVLFIHDLAVAPFGRGTGAGGLLVAASIALAEKFGLHRAELIAVEGAAGYWRRLGFTETSCSPALAAKVAGYGPAATWMTRAIG